MPKPLKDLLLTLLILTLIIGGITLIPILAALCTGFTALAGLTVLGVIIYKGVATESFSIEEKEQEK